MDAAEARLWIERYTAADLDPVLTPDEVEDLLGSALFDSPWKADSVYPSGSVIFAADGRWRALYGGSSGGAAPLWDNLEQIDGSVHWQYLAPALYDLHGAAADGWELKATKIAARYDFTIESGTWNRSQAYRHALEQADRHRAKALRSATGTGTLGMIRVAPPDRIRVTVNGLSRAP